MRRKENRFKVRRLFVLGAGASYSASTARGAAPEKRTPLDKDFCRRILDLNTQRPIWVRPAQELIRKEWKDHLPFENFGLEEAILRQVAHLEFIEAIHRRRRRGAITDFDYLNRLSHLMSFVLRKGREAKNGHYERFVRLAFPDGQRFDDIRNRIVTFNYDDLLDKHLFLKFTLEQICFDRIKESQSTSDRRTQKIDHPLMIKLHGSVNWRCSTKDFAGMVQNDRGKNERKMRRIKNVWYSRVGTPSPKDNTSPLIMPPLPIKPITSISLFCWLWTKAYEYLHEAEELIVCGYSLPDADRLAQTLFSNFRNQNLRQITVVDPDPGILSKWRQLLRRKNINTSARWTYFDDFGEYVHSMSA